MPTVPEREFPGNNSDEREMLLGWLDYLRGAVIAKVEGISDEQGRWTLDGRLIPLLGVINHLTHVEWRWIDGAMLGESVSRSEGEFAPGPELTVADAIAAYRARAARTNTTVRSMSITQPTATDEETDLRWVLIHLVNETARHAGHADATREVLDGTRGE